MSILVKCNKNIVIETPRKLDVLPCPKDCPNKGNCNATFFYPVVVRGKKQANITEEDIVLFSTKKDESNKNNEVNLNNNINQTKTTEEPKKSSVQDRFSMFNTNNNPNQTETTEEPKKSTVQDRFSMFDTNNNQSTNNFTPLVDSEESNLFSELVNSEDIIIYIGSKNYYAPKCAKKYGLKDVNVALYEIFKHWNTDVVFDNYDFTEEFKNVLKIVKPNQYSDIIRDVISYSNDNNTRFFRLFYSHIYKGNEVVKKFYYAKGYQVNEISPLITSNIDLINKISSQHDFMKKFINCEKELLIYLREDDINKLIEKLVVEINNYNKMVGYFELAYSEKHEKYFKFRELAPDSITFINNLPKVDELYRLQSKVEFLKDYEILSNGEIISRDKRLNMLVLPKIVDDGVYDVFGISNYNTSQSKDLLQAYVTLVNEYLNIVEPMVMDFYGFTFSVANFLSELEILIHNAYSKCSIVDYSNHIDIKIIYALNVLKETGILNYFKNKCMTSKIDILFDLITNDIKTSNYHSSKLENKYITHNGVVKTVLNYITDLIDDLIASGRSDQLAGILEDEIFKLYAEAYGADDTCAEVKNANNELAKLIKKMK